jgi:hypothetical protein
LNDTLAVPPAPAARLIALYLLVLVDVALAAWFAWLWLSVLMFGSTVGEGAVFGALLVLGAAAPAALAVMLRRRGKIGAAIALAAVPALLALLAAGAAWYVLSNLGPHH